MLNQQNSAVFIGTAGKSSGNAIFPSEFNRTLFSRFDKRFSIILGSCALIIFSLFGILALQKPVSDVSDKEITKIQERYARLVLNQPKPEVKTAEKTTTSTEKTAATEGKKEEIVEKTKVEREKETFVEKQKRKESGVEERRQVREQVAKQIQSSGIFAAITAAGNSGGSGGLESDLLGNVAGGTGDLSNLSISSGSFASKNDATAELSAKKGSSVRNVGIEKHALERAEVTQVASTGSVNITSQPPEVTGESASTSSERSQSAIQRVVNREVQRLKRVYEDWLKRDPSLNGSVTVKFVILPSGSVSNVSVVKSSTNNSEFDETIVRYIKRWQFPPVPDGGPVEVVYPFVFEGQS
ncbi:MAG TPA: AgmX/PglI C-terminal domain-containing protein [Chitinispirillaceae bacterium]|nr:AgmX/PglI C-terminal domain-containing protein [Chitinispirillaceae bacterium]